VVSPLHNRILQSLAVKAKNQWLHTEFYNTACVTLTPYIKGPPGTLYCIKHCLQGLYQGVEEFYQGARQLRANHSKKHLHSDAQFLCGSCVDCWRPELSCAWTSACLALGTQQYKLSGRTQRSFYSSGMRQSTDSPRTRQFRNHLGGSTGPQRSTH